MRCCVHQQQKPRHHWSHRPRQWIFSKQWANESSQTLHLQAKTWFCGGFVLVCSSFFPCFSPIFQAHCVPKGKLARYFFTFVPAQPLLPQGVRGKFWQVVGNHYKSRLWLCIMSPCWCLSATFCASHHQLQPIDSWRIFCYVYFCLTPIWIHFLGELYVFWRSARFLRNIDKTSASRHLLVEGIEMPNPRSTKSKIQNPGFNIQNPRLTKIQHPKSK